MMRSPRTTMWSYRPDDWLTSDEWSSKHNSPDDPKGG
jgi:hypothetical protein